MHTSIRLWCLVWGVMTFSALADWSPKLIKSCTPHTFFVGNNWRFHWDVSWMDKIVQIVQIHKISPNFKIRIYFQFMGLGQFLSVDWFTACSDSEKTSTSHQHSHHHHPVNWPHLCVPSESTDWESGDHH